MSSDSYVGLRPNGRATPLASLRSLAIALGVAISVAIGSASSAQAASSDIYNWDLLPYPGLGKGYNTATGDDYFWGDDFNWPERRVKFLEDNKHTTNVSYNYYFDNDVFERAIIPAHKKGVSYYFTHWNPAYFDDFVQVRIWGRNQGNNPMLNMTGRVLL